MNDLGIIAIGRNEGDRLRRCLASVVGKGKAVYVDSNSTDGSVALAKSLDVEVVELDMSLPFSAARARNEGFDRLMKVSPGTRYVQFIDGDCEVVEGWLETARRVLESSLTLAVVCGRRRERFPEKSIYNRLADIEWNTPVGRAKSCGGDAMIRVSAFQHVGGYNPAVIAGEEPEMCVRLRQSGWQIERLDAEMTLHDADMTRFAQFWKRMIRGGHAYTQGAAMHGSPPERHWVKEKRSIVAWGITLPLLMLAATILSLVFAWKLAWIPLLPALLYPLQILRIAPRERRRRKLGFRDAFVYAASVVIGKFPQAIGVLKYRIGRYTGKQTRLIEYKPATARVISAN